MPFPRSFYFLRHGETDWNRERRIQGWTDIPLNDTGRTQAAQAAVHVAGLGIELIIASPLKRAHETAQIIAAALGLPVIAAPDLRERHFGAAEGTLAGAFEELWQEGAATPSGAETRDAFDLRVMSAITRHLEQGAGKNILFVSHGGIYRTLSIALTGGMLHAENAMPYYICNTEDCWRINPV